MNKNRLSGTGYAVLAGALYAANAPCSKILLSGIAPTMMAAFLYLGAGLGMLLLMGAGEAKGTGREEKLSKEDLPYTVAMVLLDILAPVCLMTGLKTTEAANVSLLNNFEIVATGLIACFLFGEKISKRLGTAIVLVTLASMILSFTGPGSLSFSPGSLFVLLACVFWGFENNCTRKLSGKDPQEIVLIKGIFSGGGSFLIALLRGEAVPGAGAILLSLLLGFVAYGLSIFFYIRAQRSLGAAKTSAYYAVSPFIGATASLIIFRQVPGTVFLCACAVMAAGTYLASTDGKNEAGFPQTGKNEAGFPRTGKMRQGFHGLEK